MKQKLLMLVAMLAIGCGAPDEPVLGPLLDDTLPILSEEDLLSGEYDSHMILHVRRDDVSETRDLGEDPSYQEDSGDVGELEQAFTYPNGAYSYGELATVPSGQFDTRCQPAGSWVSPNFCYLPGTKEYTIWDTTGNSGNAAAGVNIPLGIADAIAQENTWPQNSGGASDFKRNWAVTSNPNKDYLFRMATGTECSGNGLCTFGAWGAIFTNGGLRFRKYVTNGGFMQITAIRPANVPLLISGTAAEKQNMFEHAVRHELGHGMGHGHRSQTLGLTPMMGSNNQWRSSTPINWSSDQFNGRINYQP